MDKLRMRFEKTGRAVYISHLDLMRTMQRAFLRAELPLRYSEGFNPHAILSIVLPLSVGTASVCELMDFRLREDVDLAGMPERLTRVLPEGIRVTQVWEPQRKAAELKWLSVEGRLEYDGRDPVEMAQAVRGLFSRDSIVITRRTKRGEGQFELCGNVRDFDVGLQERDLNVRAVLSAQEPTVNPDHLVAALRQLAPDAAPDFAAFTRLETYDADMNPFR